MHEIRSVIACVVVVTVTLIDALWCYLGQYDVSGHEIVAAVQGIGFMLFVALLLDVIRHIPRYQRVATKLRYADVAQIAAWMGLILGFSLATSVLSYLCVTVNPPLIDDNLVGFDNAVGFNWLGVYRWVQFHPFIRDVLAFAYESGAVQMVAVPIILGLFGARRSLSDFFFLLTVSALLLLLVSTPFPAASAFVHFKVSDPNILSSISDFASLRDGSKRTFDLYAMQGLVSMPSFHVCLAVLFVYVLRRVQWVRLPALALNLAMILSTPTQGGHYLADVVAGLILAAITIHAVRWATYPGRFSLSVRYRAALREPGRS